MQLEELPWHKSVFERISRSSAHTTQIIEYLVGLVLFQGPMVRIDVIEWIYSEEEEEIW